jgi:serine/threonine protein kinase
MRVCPACHTHYTGDDPFCTRDGLATLAADSRPEEDSLLGTQIGDYTITAPLGQDGIGAVYRAEQGGLGRVAAVKVLHPEHARKSQAVERFFAEVKAANQLGHENLLELLNFGFLSNRSPYLLTELLQGEDLSRLLERRGQLPLVEAFEILVPVLSALQTAHNAGLTHRDLTPRSIFLSETKQGGRVVKLLDFGAAQLDQGPPGAGRAAYLAPEQAEGRQEPDSRADVYAAGVILYEMLVGEPPFRGESAQEVLRKKLTMEPVPPKQRRPSIPARLDELALRALARDPAKRLPSAAEFAQRFAADLPTAAMSPQQIQLLLSATSSISKLPPSLLDTAKTAENKVVGDAPPVIKARVSPKSEEGPKPRIAPATASPSTEMLIEQILKPGPRSARKPGPPAPPAPNAEPTQNVWGLVALGVLVLLILGLALFFYI